ncbi:MAG: aminotransferase class I/II-fold pyridoxal phosphate-dependent enzyme, partial [Phormidesmis sp.]
MQRCADRQNAPFHTPGHKQGHGISDLHRQLFGATVFRADLPELPDLDNLFAPEGVILQAQSLAAAAFGAEQTWFLANGSTCGLEAAILATCGPGDKLILPRDVHTSAISGLILSGAVPVYVAPTYGSDWDISLGVSPDTVAQALTAHPDAKAVLLVSPTYYGVCSDLAAIAPLVHSYNIPLIIDEAHAPHFAFHPDLPISALAAGADITVQSAHKVLSAFTQAALLHMQGDRLDRHRLSQALQLTQSTSPSYLLLGSLDAARQQMATAGQALMARTLTLADQAAQALSQLPGLRILQPQWEKNHTGISGDRTRLTVDVSALGITGFEADNLLHNRFDVTAELPTLRHLMFIVSLGNTEN